MSPASIRGSWDPVDEQEAVQEVTRRYLRVYGPVGHGGLAVWWGTKASRAREIMESLGSEIAPVEIEGRKAFILRSDLASIRSMSPKDSVLLLGGFDPYTVGLCTSGQLILPDPKFKSRVSRTAGWISPVVLLNGRIAATWSHEKRGRNLLLTVVPFNTFTQTIRRRIIRQTERIAEFLETSVEVTFTPPSP
jgi:hypothetical protein